MQECIVCCIVIYIKLVTNSINSIPIPTIKLKIFISVKLKLFTHKQCIDRCIVRWHLVFIKFARQFTNCWWTKCKHIMEFAIKIRLTKFILTGRNFADSCHINWLSGLLFTALIVQVNVLAYEASNFIALKRIWGLKFYELIWAQIKTSLYRFYLRTLISP